MFCRTPGKSRKLAIIGICGFVISALVSAGAVLIVQQGSASAVGAPDCNSYKSQSGASVFSYEDCKSVGYEPDVLNADAESRDIALRLFINSLTFCTKYPDYKALEAAGWKGEKGTQNGSHWRNPDAKGESTISTTEGVINAALYPDAAVVADPNGRIGQMMWEGKKIAPLGTIPMIHDHQHNQKWEMLHIQCAPTVEGMFGFERYDMIGDQSELSAALSAAKSGGLAAVSTQLQKAGEQPTTAATSTRPSVVGANRGAVMPSRASTQTSNRQPATRQVAADRSSQSRVTSGSKKGRVVSPTPRAPLVTQR